jgi:UDP-2-acetamido-3-amino-2,3-dideoxy-glucuronate N-acetyltransferase
MGTGALAVTSLGVSREDLDGYAPVMPVPYRDCHVHHYAEVDEDVLIGMGTRVWQFASVIRGSVVGKNCSIASCAIVDGARIGDQTIVSHGAFIDPGIVIGSGVFIGPHVSLCNDAWPRAHKIGFEMEPLLDGSFVTTIIEDGASLGANVVVLPGLVVGQGSMVAAGSTVTHNIPPRSLYKRNGEIVPIKLKPVNRMRKAAA